MEETNNENLHLSEMMDTKKAKNLCGENEINLLILKNLSLSCLVNVFPVMQDKTLAAGQYFCRETANQSD